MYLLLPIHVVFYYSLRLASRCPASTLVTHSKWSNPDGVKAWEWGLLSTVAISGNLAHELSLPLHLRRTSSQSPFCTCWNQVLMFWVAISLTDSGGHFCWPCDQHLRPLILAKPREGQKDQLPLPAHACLCWPPRGHRICPSYPQHTDWGETAYFHHHTVYRHGDCVVLWGAHYSCIAVPQDTVSVQGF